MFRKIELIKRKILLISTITFFVFCLLVLRLFSIQILKGKQFKQAAISQSIREIQVAPPRGIIYDRDLIPLTNRKRINTLILNKNLVKIDDEFIKTLEQLSVYNYNDIKDLISSSNDIVEIPIKEKYNQIIEKDNVFFTIKKILRYDNNNLLSHVIGYYKKSENTGQSGIEKAYDDILKMPKDYGVLWLAVDGKKRIIPGVNYTLAANDLSKKPNSVKLTVDYHIQKSVEKVMDENNVNGTVIVAEVESGDILAISSRPNLDKDNMEIYLKSGEMEFYNKAIQISYPPGSIFKIVVLISALEENIFPLNEKFTCNGYEKVGNTTIRCHSYDQGGHGIITIREAFSESCNSAFIKLGKRVGSEKIIQTAKKLGFGKAINIGLPEEIQGNLPEGNQLLGPAIGNISIGQGEIEVTPLQVTNMMLILANNGILKDMTIVDGIVTEDGHMVKKFNKDKDKRIISTDIAYLVKNLMEDVVEKGTANNISLEEYGGGAGKTGSAQAIYKGKPTIHAWFSGYYPKYNPCYVITVLVENGESGGKTAAPIFEKVVKELSKLNR